MKFKAFALSIAMVAVAFSANAQEAEIGKDVFIGIGGGVISTVTNHFNTPAVYGQIQVGKYITPVWGVRAVIAGPFQKYDQKNKSWDVTNSTYWEKKQLFGELNIDGMINLSHVFSKVDFPKVDFFIFAGPTINFSTACTSYTGKAYEGGLIVENNNAFKARVGATAGLAINYNFTKKLALGIEGRFGVTPSIFGDASICRKAEGTARGTLNLIYTIGGKNGKSGYAAKIAKAAGYVSAAEAAAMVADALEKNPKIIEKPVEKIVEKIVEKEVAVNVPTTTAVFFTIGKADLAVADKARIKLLAESIKAGKAEAKYEIAGYADKATGSAKFNQKLSEKRAQKVFDSLVAEGVNPAQLTKVANGGVEAMFFGKNSLSRTAIVKPVE